MGRITPIPSSKIYSKLSGEPVINSEIFPRINRSTIFSRKYMESNPAPMVASLEMSDISGPGRRREEILHTEPFNDFNCVVFGSFEVPNTGPGLYIFDQIILIKTIKNIPPAIAEIIKNRGNRGVYHKACRRWGETRKSDPSDEWCNDDNEIPIITATKAILWNSFAAFLAFIPFKMIGANSIEVIVKYNKTHAKTSNRNESMFHIRIGCQNLKGNPISKSSAKQEHPYPKNAINIAGFINDLNSFMCKT